MITKNILDHKKIFFGSLLYKVVVYDQNNNVLETTSRAVSVPQYVDKGGYPAVEALCVQGLMPNSSRDALLVSGFLASTEGDQLPDRTPIENSIVPLSATSDQLKVNAWTTDYELALELQKEMLVQFDAELVVRENDINRYRILLNSILEKI